MSRDCQGPFIWLQLALSSRCSLRTQLLRSNML